MEDERADKLRSMIGSETGRSPWFVVDQERIDRFAEVVENRGWIHVDPDAASRTPFGSTIAHGFLTLSLLDHLLAQAGVMPDGVDLLINYGANKIRYLHPVTPGSQIRAVNTLLGVEERAPGQRLLTNRVVVEIDGAEKPALVAEVLYLAISSDTSS